MSTTVKGTEEPFKTSLQSTDGYVKALDTFASTQRLVVGTKNGEINIFEAEFTDLFLEHNYPNAHSSEITGISTHSSSLDLWVSCSVDKSCLLWDKRSSSCVRILRNYGNWITAVYWTKPEENDSLVMVGDEIGNVITLDIRRPNAILNKTRVADRGITGIHFNGSKQFAVLARNQTTKVFNAANDGDPKLLLEHRAPGMLYSMCWDVNNSNVFYLCGEGRYAEKLSIV